MTISMLGIGVDCADAASLAQFWADALGRTLAPDPTAEYAAVDPASNGETGPLLMFHQVPEPKSVKNRLHLDLITSQIAEEKTRLLALGATVIRDLDENGGRWISFADPEANEFDLVAG